MADKVTDAGRNGIEAGAEKAKGAANWVSEKADSAKDAALGLVDVVQQRAKNVSQAVSDTAHKVRDQGGEWLSDKAHQVESAVGECRTATSDAIEHFGRDVTAVIRRHPMTAVAIGLGLGLLLGRAASKA